MLLQPIFEAQRKLMDKYAQIEIGVSTHEVPVQLNTREGQQRLRQFAWFYVEELGEAIQAKGSSSFHEELIDALHFITELSILSGLTAEDIVVPATIEPNELTLYADWAPKALAAISAITFAINALKAKPWKQSYKDTDPGIYQQRVRLAYFKLLELMKASGVHLGTLPQLYMGKNETNHNRIASGY